MPAGSDLVRSRFECLLFNRGPSCMFRGPETMKSRSVGRVSISDRRLSGLESRPTGSEPKSFSKQRARNPQRGFTGFLYFQLSVTIFAFPLAYFALYTALGRIASNKPLQPLRVIALPTQPETCGRVADSRRLIHMDQAEINVVAMPVD